LHKFLCFITSIARANQRILSEKSGISVQLSCKIAGKNNSKIRRKMD